MGTYTEYINQNFSFAKLEEERKKQLKRISEARGGRDVFVMAADLTKDNPNIGIDYSDLLPVEDQLSTLTGSAIDVIVETPGGSAEVAEDIIRLIRRRYQSVGMIVPGWAKSAGTIMVMAGDEILMGEGSALGPIDAQVRSSSGQVFSAHAFLEGLEALRNEIIQNNNVLDLVYVPMLQTISPGEIQHCKNAQDLSQNLVREWLKEFKFKNWTTRQTTGEPVTDAYKTQRAKEIAADLCDQSRWKTHGRSLHKGILEKELKLKITDYSLDRELDDAIRRYYTLLRISFETNMFKLFETLTRQIYRFSASGSVPNPVPSVQQANMLEIGVKCPKCQHETRLQANLDSDTPLQTGLEPYPVATDTLKCAKCGTEINLTNMRLQVEAQSGKKIQPFKI